MNALYSIAADTIINGYSEELLSEYEDLKTLINADLILVKESADTKDEMEWINYAIEQSNTFEKLVEEVLFIGLNNESLNTNEIESIDEDLDYLKNEYYDTMSKIVDSLGEEAVLGDEKYDTRSKEGIILSIIISLLVAILLTIFMIIIIIGIIKPINGLTHIKKKQSRLDFSFD